MKCNLLTWKGANSPFYKKPCDLQSAPLSSQYNGIQFWDSLYYLIWPIRFVTFGPACWECIWLYFSNWFLKVISVPLLVVKSTKECRNPFPGIQGILNSTAESFYNPLFISTVCTPAPTFSLPYCDGADCRLFSRRYGQVGLDYTRQVKFTSPITQ